MGTKTYTMRYHTYIAGKRVDVEFKVEARDVDEAHTLGKQLVDTRWKLNYCVSQD